MTALFLHAAYGLRIGSDLRLSGLEDDTSQTAVPDVHVRLALPGEILSAEADAALTTEAQYAHAAEGEIILAWRGVGVYRLRNGNEIAFAPAPGSAPEQARLILEGAALAMLLRQRGLTALHASGVVIGGAVLLSGESGSGKSTLASALNAHGFPLLTDDLAVLQGNEDQPGLLPHVLPGPPRVKLWPDAAAALNLPPLSPLFPGIVKGQTRTPMFPTPVPLRAIYLLAVGPTLEIVPQPPSAALLSLAGAVYGAALMARVGSADAFQRLAALARLVPVRFLHRPRSLDPLQETVRLIEEDLLAV